MMSLEVFGFEFDGLVVGMVVVMLRKEVVEKSVEECIVRGVC